MSLAELEARIAAMDWTAAAAALDRDGHAVLPRLLSPEGCREAAAMFAEEARFRRRIVMERHGYGQGVYQYFAAPLPDTVAALREALYRPLAAVANGWAERLGRAVRFPDTHAAYIARCHAAGQTRPTPLMLRYGPGDYNCLHQDLYGEEVFPIQAVVLLSRPGTDFTGGEFALVEQRPRRQSKVEILPLAEGDAALFAVRDRPARGARGWYTAQMRHGVSPVRSGERTTLGIIFHDAA
ncbi:hypothetical protein EDC65_0738 [Stella humosa]|uniref:Fe2OG dioxygenase domain-containing protein n=1 Tax=Stella humosa TaxID=94 RepID=A0A3N1MD88_9PROT|nr:2OG-Fe(II) oxygenase [Stella humosa]ROQ01558.1 hypothetical protein EDC65_0738 [Stella humosa]BBK31938.1 prolyl 4-hydroxylase [Stella humosa]